VRDLLSGSVESAIRDFDAAFKVLQLGDCPAVLRLQGKGDELMRSRPSGNFKSFHMATKASASATST
jgi:hypothetical protein